MDDYQELTQLDECKNDSEALAVTWNKHQHFAHISYKFMIAHSASLGL